MNWFNLQKAILMSSTESRLKKFAEDLQYANPFDENRVNQTDFLVNDVRAIHADAFEQLTNRARKASQNKGMGCGVVVTGPPGVGKSHLLARFGEWARREKYPFVYLLNLQAGPNDILRTILRTSISILTKGMATSPGQTRLYRMVSATINQALTAQNLTHAVDMPTAQKAYQAMRNRLDGDPSIYHVMWLFFEDVFCRIHGRAASGRAELAKRWLSGGSLDPQESKKLNLNDAMIAEDGCTLDLELMKEVLKVLCQFAGFRQRSFILCFDQVDTLTTDQVESWSAATHALLDICPRLLVVTSGVDTTFIKWAGQNVVSQSSWDRIRQFSINLSGVDADAARTMIQDRLRACLDQFESLPETNVLRTRDALFPLGENWAKRTLFESTGVKKSDLRPRSVINQAGSAWDREAAAVSQWGVKDWLETWPSDTAEPNLLQDDVEIDLPRIIDQRVAAKIEEHRQSRLLRPEELPVDAGNVAGLLTSILKSCESASLPFKTGFYSQFGAIIVSTSKSRTKPAFQFLIEQWSGGPSNHKNTIGVAIAEASSGNAATNLLKRMIAELDGSTGPDQAILIVDSRDPLQLADKGQACFEELKSQPDRFTYETLDFEQYAMLDAFEAVVGMARSGDLEAVLSHGIGRPISEAEVYESHHRNQRYFGSSVLRQLIGTCTTSEPSGVPPASHFLKRQPSATAVSDGG